MLKATSSIIPTGHHHVVCVCTREEHNSVKGDLKWYLRFVQGCRVPKS
jgi:hypothetical protein